MQKCRDHANRANAWPKLHGASLYSYALSRLKDHDTAHDAVQETYMAALKNIDQLDRQRSERAWLFGILKHKIVDECRFHQRERSMARPELRSTGTGYEELPVDDRAVVTTGTAPSRPETRAEEKALVKLCRAGIRKLPDSLAKTFSLKAIDELPNKAICQRLDITPTNLWVRTHRARKLMQKWIGDVWLDDASVA